MDTQEKSLGNDGKGFLMITDKYYMGHDAYNVIIYTKHTSKTGKISYGDCKYFPNIKTAINRIMELAEISCVGPDVEIMVEKFRAIRNEVISALQWVEGQ